MSLSINWQPSILGRTGSGCSVYQAISFLTTKLKSLGFVPKLQYKFNHVVVVIQLMGDRERPYEEMLSTEVFEALKNCKTKDEALNALDNLEMEMKK